MAALFMGVLGLGLRPLSCVSNKFFAFWIKQK
jgi:hypothetical protein